MSPRASLALTTALALLCALAVVPQVQAQTQLAAASDLPADTGEVERGVESLILSITINGVRVEEATLVQRRADGFYLPVSLLTGARVKLPEGTRTYPGAGAEYVRLADLPALRVSLDMVRQDLVLTIAAAGFEGQVIDLASRPQAKIDASASGAFFNYDALLQSGAGNTYAAGLFDVGAPVFGGGFASSAIMRTGGDASKAVRLETSFTQDFQDDLARVKFGDAVSRGGDWGRPARFGGLQYATNFAVQPGYVAYPTATFAGQAALPSTVDIYVNDALRYRGSVEQGPFELNQIPALTGGGDARVVVTDPLGRQQAVTVPFYVSPRILREGVSDFSYEAGLLRTGYGTSSAGYGDVMASGTHRYGLSNTHTIEGHAEATAARQAVGASLTSTYLSVGEVHEEVALVRGPNGTGWLAGAGYSRQSEDWTFGIRHRRQSANFDDGSAIFSSFTRARLSETVTTLGLNLKDYGTLSVSAARQTFDGANPATVSAITWTKAVNESTFVSAYLLDTRQDSRNTTVGLTVTMLLGATTTASVDTYSRNGKASGSAQVRQSPNGELGWAYGATMARGDLNRNAADIAYRSTSGDVGFAVDQVAGQAAGRLSASGGVALANGKIYSARRIDDAFGVISVPGYEGVTVLQENRPVGKTDADGDLFLPRLQSNFINNIAISTADLPIEADLERLEATVTPRHRGIAQVKFQVQPSTSQLVVLRDGQGQFIEPGVEVVRVADAKTFRSGFDGEVYLQGSGDDWFEAVQGKNSCRFRLPQGKAGNTPTNLTCMTVP